MNIITNEQLVSLTVHDVQELLYGSDDLYKIQYQSSDPNIPDHRPKIIRRHVGLMIKNKDILEEYLHVELYPTHAEVWLRSEWQESNTRLMRRRESELQRQAREAAIEERASIAFAILIKEIDFVNSLGKANVDRLSLIASAKEKARLIAMNRGLAAYYEMERQVYGDVL